MREKLAARALGKLTCSFLCFLHCSITRFRLIHSLGGHLSLAGDLILGASSRRSDVGLLWGVVCHCETLGGDAQLPMAERHRQISRETARGSRQASESSVGRVSRRVYACTAVAQGGLRDETGSSADERRSCLVQRRPRCARIDVGDKRKNTGANNEAQEHVKRH